MVTPIMHPVVDAAAADDENILEDVCSICLEAFDSQDNPPTVTTCKHEYHLQCILEWSQRSKECPICWQVIVLKNPASQELLEAVANERSLRSGLKVRHVYEEPQLDHVGYMDVPYMDNYNFEEQIMRTFEAARSRVRYVNRGREQRLSGAGPSQGHPSVSNADLPIGRQGYASLEELHSSGYVSSQVDLMPSSPMSTSIGQTSPSLTPSTANVVSQATSNRDYATMPRSLDSQTQSGSPGRPIAADMHAFSESVKSKFSAASARYKESISKSTRGLKEKLLAQNSPVKELSRGVQREMSAGIAGVARMIERLDLASKRTAPLSNNDGANSDLSFKGKSTQENVISLPLPENYGETARTNTSLNSVKVSGTVQNLN